MMGKIISLIYGIVAYLLFLVSFVYAIGFVGDFGVPKTVDSGMEATSQGQALVVNAILLALFAIQHSVMARKGFKKWWTKIIPRHLERSSYVLISSLILLLLYWQWRPMPEVIWTVETGIWNYLLSGLFWAGWILVFVSSFSINHFDLFGLRQVWLHLKGREITPIEFKEPGPYKYVRHPLMLGFLIAFWATPQMTVGHLVFSVATTGYILVGIWFEEKDLVRYHGEKYRKYRKRVRMLVPIPKKMAVPGTPTGDPESVSDSEYHTSDSDVVDESRRSEI